MRHFLCFLLLGASSIFGATMRSTRADDRPNIVWIIVEDQSRHYGCYGEALVQTPNIDRLASRGAKFTNCAVTAPVCSAARSALITGTYQTSIGAHHHRSGRGTAKIFLPDHVKLLPEYFQDAGYFTCLGSMAHVRNPGRAGFGKSDYNFQWDSSVYDAGDWSTRKEGQPFFAQIQLAGGKARANARKSPAIPHVMAEDVKLPPYYPRHPKLLEDWAAYLDTFSLMDVQVGEVLKRLDQENVLDKTIVFFMTDHGVSHARGKQFCYDEGIMVPLIVAGPGVTMGVRDELASHVDIGASSLYFAGIDIPSHLESRTLFGPEYQKRDFLVTARDRCDETYDRIRSVRTSRFKYIRNGYPQRPHLQPNVYKDNRDNYKALYQARELDMLNDLQQRILFSPTRATEELYDLKTDPWELQNLASDPAYQKQLAQLRNSLDVWIARTGDQGQQVEPMSMYDSDMAQYVNQIGRNRPQRARLIEKNIALMKKWWDQGK